MSGVLTSVPWNNEAPITKDAESYFNTPDGSQFYDWDHATDTLHDVAPAISSQVSQCDHTLIAPSSTQCKLLQCIMRQPVLVVPNNPCSLLSTAVHFHHTNRHVALSDGVPHSVWASGFVTDCGLLDCMPLLQDASMGEDFDNAADESDEGSDDEERFAEDDNIEFEPGHGVEDMLRMLEEGGALPDIEGLMEAEDAQVRTTCSELGCPAMLLCKSIYWAVLSCPWLGCLGCC